MWPFCKIIEFNKVFITDWFEEIIYIYGEIVCGVIEKKRYYYQYFVSDQVLN